MADNIRSKRAEMAIMLREDGEIDCLIQKDLLGYVLPQFDTDDSAELE